jgi:Coenzyme PQQ synthesis protein D (PqqD)
MMEITFSQRIAAPDDVLIQMLDGEAVLLNLDTESYFGLDEVGARMWTLLTESDSIQTAYEALLKEYDVTPEQLRADLIGLIDRLAEQGLIKPDATME